MGVKLYRRDEHPAGWIGFRVTVGYNGKWLQKYFTTRNCRYQDDRCVEFKKQRLRAELQDARWMAESALYQYHKFVSENHPSTLPGRGLGFMGMTASFTIDRRDKYQAVFLVHWYDRKPSGKQPRKAREFTFRTLPYSEVWKDAVSFWAEVHCILDVDRDRIIKHPPAPALFTHLRREMNEMGAGIPIEALTAVFREQRESLADQRVLREAASRNRIAAPLTAAIEEQLASWFERNRNDSRSCTISD